MASDSATATFWRTATPVNDERTAGIYQQAAAYTLPATLTLATAASAYVPVFGLTSTGSGF